MTIDNKLEKLERLSMQIEAFAAIRQKDSEPPPTTMIAIACLEIAVEHIRSAVILARRFHYNTAFALMRLQNESLIRAFWWTHCATPDDLEKFKADKFSINYDKMKSDLEGSGKGKIYRTVETLRRNVASQHSYAHTGRDPVSRRLASSSRASVGGVFDEETSEQLFVFNEALLLRVALAYSELFSDPVFNMNIQIVFDQFDCIQESGIVYPEP